MTRQRFSSYGGEESLAPLVGTSTLLDVRHGHLVALDKLPVPTDEYDIPQPKEFIRDVLGSLATKHIWTGYFDVHHIAWPDADYKRLNKVTESLVGGRYRGASALKIRLPRQLHNYIHVTTEPPRMPHLDIMRQWTKEQDQVNRLYDTVSRKNMCDSDMPEERREKYRFHNYLQKLEDMDDGELGLMPSCDYLADLELDDARRTLRAIAKVQGFSNVRRQQRRFFAESIVA